MAEVAFWLVCGSLTLNIATTAWSILRPGQRVWPPPGDSSWQYYYSLTLSLIWMLAFLALGILDWNSFRFEHWSRFVLGGAAIVGGVAAAQRAVRALSLHATRGLEGELVTDGPYRYSRNPQYVAYIAVVIGYAVLCNSGLSLVAAGPATVAFLLGPFAEEAWLRERLGDRFEAYVSRVPRFLGRRRASSA
jgi:protein-S-isoprenylcysteine O-methyltransferase Ste14